MSLLTHIFLKRIIYFIYFSFPGLMDKEIFEMHYYLFIYIYIEYLH